MDSWTFSPLQYWLGWRAFGRDMLSYPIEYRPNAADHVHRRAAVEDLVARLDPDLHAAFGLLAAPEVRVQVCGFEGAHGERKIRLHAAIRQQFAVLVEQDPGPRPDRGGTVRMALVDAAGVAERVVAALPYRPAGCGGSLRAPVARLGPLTDDQHYQRASWMQPMVKELTEADRITTLLAQPRTGIGHVAVCSGAAVDYRPSPRDREFHWFDFDDGRYLAQRNSSTYSIGPANGPGIVEHLNLLIAEVRRPQ